jgi:restriction system protein
MAIPEFQDLMLPMLQFHADGHEHCSKENVDFLRRKFGLSEEEISELLPSGKQSIFNNRVSWAKSYLKMAGLLDSNKRGIYKITERGTDVLTKGVAKIDIKFLNEFLKKQKPEQILPNHVTTDREQLALKTPEETLDESYQSINIALSSDILEKLKSCTPSFFERIVVDVIVTMGYGGTLKDAGKAIGKSGDGGIDGIIKEDRLGLDNIYIQAKKWDSAVGRPEIQKFVGALSAQKSKKGIFITTSTFTKDAIDYVSKIDMKVVLIDGETLAGLMLEHNIGVTTVKRYELKRLDSDYYEE